jgi:uncharacterized protein (DUF58 family)
MPTRQGWTVLAGAVLALVIGRIFGIEELFVIAVGLAAAVGAGVLAVRLRRPRYSVRRWVHPAVLTVGDTGRVDLTIRNEGAGRSPRTELTEPVGPVNTARMAVAPLRRGEQVTAGYRVPASRRGVLQLGPLEVERRDLLGLAATRSIGADLTEVMVAPRTFELPMPALGHGVLGRHLLAQAQRLGPGEFHSLRDYVDGDEPRSIHWRASARSTELKVRQHTTEGVRRCIVVMDRSAQDAPPDDPEAFERAISISASLVQAADRAGLTTRFVTAGDIDLRGPDVASQTLKVLAPIELGGDLGDIERDPGEGLGLVLVVAPSPASATWRRTEQISDPTLVRVGVFTVERPGGTRLAADATSVEAFRDEWSRLAGQAAAAATYRRPERPVGAEAADEASPEAPDRPWMRVPS